MIESSVTYREGKENSQTGQNIHLLLNMTLYVQPSIVISRLSEQAQRQLQDSERFEDILLGASRPTAVIQRYEELYSQARMEALDAFEAVQIKGNHQKRCQTTSTAAMDASDIFNVKLLLEVFKVNPYALTTGMDTCCVHKTLGLVLSYCKHSGNCVGDESIYL